MTSDAGLRSRLVELYARRPKSLDLIVRMTDADDWHARMAGIEEALGEFDRADDAHKRGKGPIPEDGALARALASDKVSADLYECVRDSTPGRLVFQMPPRFSDADPMLVGALARFADIKPSLDGNLVSRDRVFTRIFEKAVKQPVLVMELLREDFARMAALSPEMFEQLAAIAAQPTWSEQMELIEKQLERGRTDVPDALSPPAKQLLALAEPVRPPDDDTADAVPVPTTAAAGTSGASSGSGEPARSVSVLLQGPVRFSAMLREEVQAFALVKDKLDPAETLVKTNTDLSDSERQRTEAQAAIGLLADQHLDVLENLKRWLDVRIEAAQHYVELRSFLKLEALRLSWPALTGYLSDRRALLELESFAQSGKADETVLGRLSDYRRDLRLMRFLRLRPWLKDMSPGQLKAYLATSPAVDAPLAAAPPATGIITPAPVVAIDTRPTEEAIFTVARTDTGIGVTLVVEGETYKEDDIKLPPAETIAGMTLDLWHDAQRVSMLGRALFESAFPDKLRQPLLKALKDHPRMRLWIKPPDAAVLKHADVSPATAADMNDAALFNLPWEAMYVGELNGFVAAQGCSIVRMYAAGRPIPALRFDRPLRVLAVFSNPSTTAPLDVDAEIETLNRVCAAARDSNLVQLTVLDPRSATRDNLRQAIRAVRPQVFHFTGHGIYDQENKEGALVVGEKHGHLDLMLANQVGTLLSNNGVLLTLLNSCDTGTSVNNAAVTGIAGTLVRQGIPAVIATLRQVTDQTAIMFTRNFYSALVEGESVEAAMYQTRTALEIERQDWSVYALYASTHDLDRLVADVPRRRAAAALPA